MPGRFDAKGNFKPGSTLEVVKKIPPKRSGTRVRFWPDLEIFDPGLTIEYELVRDHCAQVCFLVPGLKVRLIDKRGSAPREPEEFVAKGGLADLVETMSIGEAVTEVVTLHGTGTFEEKVPVEGRMTLVERTCTVDVALRWVKGFDASVTSFVNTIPTPEGGTHVAGFERAMTKVDQRRPARRHQEARQAGQVRQGPRREGRRAGGPGRRGQGHAARSRSSRARPSRSSARPPVQSIVYEVVRDGFTNWIEGGGRKTHVAAVREKVAQAVLTRVSTKASLDLRRKAATLSQGAMPDKLADCRTHGRDAELLIVEGDSAAGPAKAGRNAEYMAVLPLRGKVVNAGKSTLKQVIENAEAQALFSAIGAGSGKDFNLDAARYGRIIILCDADVDGSHIRCLLLTLIYHYMRPLLEDGRVFAAQPPLYTVKVGDQVVHAFSDEHKAELTEELTKGNRKAENLQWVRFKGLGEMDVEELAVTCLDPGTRILRRITMDDAESRGATRPSCSRR